MRSDLSKALTGDNRAVFVALADLVCDFNHQPAHYNGEVVLGAVVADSLLNFGERNAVEDDIPAEFRHFLAELLDFKPRSVGGVRRAYIVYAVNDKSAFRHHITRNGAVDTARKHKQSVAA